MKAFYYQKEIALSIEILKLFPILFFRLYCLLLSVRLRPPPTPNSSSSLILTSHVQHYFRHGMYHERKKVNAGNYRFWELAVSFRMTSWAPPSTMEVAETMVSFAFCCSSGIVSAPQLHMVERTFARDCRTPSDRLPA